MSNQLSIREEKLMNTFELEGIKNQVSGMLGNDTRKIESFKSKMLSMSMEYGLKNCSPESIINCGIQALMVDLPLVAGQGYVVNYGGQAQFDCGFKGWQVLAKRAGFSVQADVVYSCDEFGQDGFGFNREMTFKPDYASRKSSDDQWAKENLTGVIVSIMEDETGIQTHAFVDAEMIFKITAMSPSAGKKSKKDQKYYSPHDKWAEQMFRAKAIKHVLSKFPIDIEQASQLNQAIDFANQSEAAAQEQFQAAQQSEYAQHKFDENYPKWEQLVKDGKKSAMSIITMMSNGWRLSQSQLEKIMDLKNHEPIEAEAE